MPSKYQAYRQMADTAERQLTSSYKSWTQFLRTAARLYKYPYNEQVMIHAQRPDATACAEYDFWNKKMGRFVRRGSTGIALIDTSGQKPQLRYVFDVADTGERERSRPMHLWQFRTEHEEAVSAALERSYDVSGNDGIVEQMESAAEQLAKEYWTDHKRDILYNIDDSYLDGYDEFNTEVQFRNAARVSITYMLMSRCGLEPEAYLEPEDFLPVFDFNTPATVAALGMEVSEISQQVLRQIEVAIRNYERERSQNHDRIDLYEERRLPDSRFETERGTGEQTPGQVRDAAEDLPSGASPHPLESDDPVRDAVPASAGNRRESTAEAGADDAGADEVGRRDGELESQRPDALGGADEQLQGAGGRDYSERAGVQLTPPEPEAEPVQPPISQAYQLSLFPTLNLRDVRIYDTIEDADGREKRVLNSKETTLAQQKQQAIKDAFQEWIWKDPTRRHDLVQKYNELFNSTRPREYNGQHITFSGMNPEIQLREHQLNAVAHILYGGNTLLAHEVGAGKTFEMVAAAMESKRLGLCHKPMFVVPNHLIEQWASEFLRLYPSANILAVTKKDFEPRNRKKFCARIATGDYDAVIIGHSQFERIPVSKERQDRMLQEQIYEIEDGLMELKANNAERFTIKSLEKTKKSLEVKLKKLQDTSRKDDVITFEQLGVDRLYVDEAHAFKNLFLYTKMRNVAGLSTTDAQKSSDMLLKCRYIDEITGNKGIVFATGTPVSNSMTELYTMMRYLQHDMLQRKHLTHFDCWASTFGETATAIELAPEGTGYRARTRFSKFFNLPELMQLFKEAADIKTADQLHLPTPTPIYHNVVAQPTEIQKGMVQELSERAARVHAGIVDASTDNMLKITSDGRKLGLDQRVINPDLPDEAGSKVNLCVDNIYSVWKDGQADKLTQLVFCDLSTPKAAVPASRAAKAAGGNLDSPELHALEAAIGQDTSEEPAFTIYDDIREKLVARGIPREQIAFIHEANTEVRKKELFAKVRAGQVRVLMGSTFKMGAGMNVQDRLVALHDLDCPWRPGDLEQRSGRIIRQGNRNKEVHIYRYVTESTFDAYLWQTVENKQKFISQIMTSKSPVRSCEDVDETALSYAEIKALCAGDERIKEKMDLDVDVARLKLMKASHQSQQYKLEDSLLKKFPEDIEKSRGFISGLEADMKTLAAHSHPEDGFAGMTVKNDNLTDKDNAGAALLEAFKDVRGMEPVPIGTYRGFQMSLTLEDFGKDYVLTLKGQMTHRVTLGKDARGNLTRIDNVLNAMPDRLQNVRNTLDATTAQMEAAKAELGKPFPQEEELRVKSARLAELNAELNIDERTPMEQLADDAAISAKAERPSVLARLKNTPTRQTQDTPEKQREQESR